MKPLSTGSLSVFLACLLATTLATAAETKNTPASEETRAAALVRQLGADDFEVREQAFKDLALLGRKAEKFLRDGTKDTDMEIAHRCQELLTLALRNEMEVALDTFLVTRDEKHLLKLPAWTKFRETVGDLPDSRPLFVQMCCAEGALLDLAARDPASAAVKFAERTQTLQQNMFQIQPFGGARGGVSVGEVASLLYLAGDTRLGLQQTSLYQLTNLIRQPDPKQAIENATAMRKLLARFIEKRNDATMIHQNLYLIQSFNLKECLGWVAEQATAKGQQPYVRATALIALGKIGNKEHIAKLEPLLTDATSVGQSQFNTIKVNTQLRDVALAMMIQLSGQDLGTYDFPYLKAIMPHIQGNPNVFYSYPYFGFTNDAQREAALKQWKDSQVAARKK